MVQLLWHVLTSRACNLSGDADPHICEHGTDALPMSRSKPQTDQLRQMTKGNDFMDRMLVVVFDNESKAYEGKQALLQLDAEGSISVYAYSVLAKGADGTATIKQGDDTGPLRTFLGTSLGSLIGLLGGPAGVAVGAAAGMLGGATADLNNARAGCAGASSASQKLLKPTPTNRKRRFGPRFTCSRSFRKMSINSSQEGGELGVWLRVRILNSLVFSLRTTVRATRDSLREVAQSSSARRRMAGSVSGKSTSCSERSLHCIRASARIG
jgi:hypothetical protein